MKLRCKTNLYRDEHGVLTHLMLALFIGIILSTGVALDLIRQDSERTDLQDALDRGVVAAASLTQTIDPETTVREYLENRAFSDDALRVLVTVDEGLNYRSVTGSVEYDMPTIFLRMVGLSTLTVPARAAATQSDPDVEISLVLDISGSMAREVAEGTASSRLAVLRWAAAGFVDTVLTDAARPKTTISLVPFAGQVNAGPLFDILNATRVHDYASCVEFTDSDFDASGLPAANSLPHTPQFQWFRFEGDYGFEAEWGWCPSDALPILPFSNDPDALKAEIAAFVGHDGTGTQIGLKFGLGLLDPSSRPITAALVAAGTVDAAFETRPAPFKDPGALKVIVIMTDGNIRYQQRPMPEYADSPAERAELMSNRLPASNALLPDPSSQGPNENLGRSNLLSLCRLAKKNGVIVFTIGFDVTASSPAHRQMASCASSAGHFYRVQGLELDVAFQQIASTIVKLKLVE